MINESSFAQILGDKIKISNVSPLTGGANNKVYKINIFEHSSLILKKYFSHPNDSRNRLEAETSFLKYTEEKNISSVPKLILENHKKNIAIFSFIRGKDFSSIKITEDHVEQAANFFSFLNINRKTSINLPLASEACVKPIDYIVHIEKRVLRFQDLLSQKNEDTSLKRFLNECLFPKYKIVKKELLENLKKLDININQNISKNNLCITPSDFGFHNALLTSNNIVNFIDFEYAGIDDPIKTLCDFFLQPKYPVKIEYLNNFISKISHIYDINYLENRVEIFMPICTIKWCFILLNSFLKEGKNRRSFSNSKENNLHQIHKAEILLNNLNL